MEATLTVEDLAHELGLTVRNIRAYQTHGLLDPPERRGRTGYYTSDHVARLSVIRDLRERGFGLEGIRRVLANAPAASADDLESYAELVADSYTGEEPEIVDATELAAGWGESLTPELAQRTYATGLYRPRDDGTVEVLSPTLEAAGRELAALGIPLEAAIEVLERQLELTRQLAATYVDMFMEHVAKPLVDDGRLPELDRAVARVQPLALRGTVAAMILALRDEIRRAGADA
jgi:DNA-binding transcriptional MerR regulator